MRRLLRRTLTVGGITVGAFVLLESNPTGRRVVRHAARDVVRRTRYLRGVADGAWYRIRGGRPNPDVSDDILTQRVRSSLGRFEKQRDLPRVHVMVEDQVVLLHGEVPTAEDLFAIEREVLDVPGVRAVASYLHIGLTPGTTRPSAGHATQAQQPSDALRALLQAARDAGAAEDEALASVRAVLGTFSERIPEDEREQLLSHLPRDARDLAEPPRRHGRPSSTRTVPQLVATVGARSGIGRERANTITEAVLGRLRILVPEEAADIAAVLPPELSRLWINAVPAQDE
jgi:uncharacterized protein (DUF2267 family)